MILAAFCSGILSCFSKSTAPFKDPSSESLEESVMNAMRIQAVWRECDNYRHAHGSFPAIRLDCGLDRPERGWHHLLLAEGLLRQAKWYDGISTAELSRHPEFKNKLELYASAPQRLLDCGSFVTSAELDDFVREIERPSNRVRSAYVQARLKAPCTILAASGSGTVFGLLSDHNETHISNQAILLIEGVGDGQSWWEQPEQELASTLNGVGSRNSFGFLVAFVDGTVWRLSHKMPKTLLQQFMRNDYAGSHSRDEELRQWKQAAGPP